MSLIAWRDEFSLGIEAIDHEHREMIELINELDRSIQNDASQDSVAEALGEIYAHIAAHFALEEKMMRAWRYPEYPSHKQDHETLLDVLLEIIDSVDEEGTYDRDALSSDLDRWFSDHFRTHDARLHHKS
jgi:hemerythrin